MASFTSTLFAFCCIAIATSGGEIGCSVPGECVNGQYMAIVKQDTSEGCLEYCQENEECNFFTFYPDGICMAFIECPEISTGK